MLIIDGLRLASYLAKKLLATHFPGSTNYYLCLFMQTLSQLGSYIHACTIETYSLANLQDLIPICQATQTSQSRNHILQICLRMCFICTCINVTTQLEWYLHQQTQIVVSAGCGVGSQQFLNYRQLLVSLLFSYCDPYYSIVTM